MPRLRRDPVLQRFLLEDEQVVVDVRQHWAIIALPVLYTLAGLILVLWVDSRVRVDAGSLARLLWLLWFGLLGWAAFQVAQWRHDRFIATNRRLLLDYGIFSTKVAMMPLIKVTDMSYQRTVPGRLLGYGRFVLESAGQDQALRQIDWVPRPDEIYRNICQQMFGARSWETVIDVDRDDGYYDPSAPVGVASPLRLPLPSPIQENRSYSRAIPLHRRGGAPPTPSGETLYSSDEDRRRRRMAETGPMPEPPPAQPPLPPEADD